MGDRSGRLRGWLLLDGDRLVVATAISLWIFLSLFGLASLGILDVSDAAAVRGVANGLIPGLFTFLSIVLAINQLVLSQEFGSAGVVRDRFEAIQEFRHDVEAVADTAPSPIRPTAFLDLVVGTLGDTADRLHDAGAGNASARRDVHGLAAAVRRETRRADRILDRSDPGRITAIRAVLDVRDARHLHEARRVRATHGSDLSAAADRALADLIEILELFGVARTHFRTTYTQRVLARLSRLLLYVGVPAIFTAVLLSLLPQGGDSTADPVVRRLLLTGLLTVGLAPLSVLSAYVLRIAAVSERTIGQGPFVSRPNAGPEPTGRGARRRRGAAEPGGRRCGPSRD